MGATVNAIGSLTSVIGTEVNVNREYTTTSNDNKWFSYYIDCHNMASGDIVEIRVYSRVQTGGTLRVESLDILLDAQTEPVWFLPSMPNDNGLLVTVKQTQGSPRTFYYRIYEI